MFAISCDWGTTTFRIRLLRDDPGDGPRVLAERTSASGIAAFAPRAEGEYRAFLAVEIPALFAAAGTAPQHAPVILSGMITSSLGWKQPPYAQLPFPLDGSAAVIERDRLETVHGTHELVFVSGVRGADEVMRGEECELIGLYGQPESVPFRDSSVAILPGTHSKTLEIGAGRVNTFRTFLTGELFDVLCRHSILRHSVGSGGAAEEAGPCFEEGVARSARDGLLGSLFSVRARSLLDGAAAGPSREYLSGLVIGDEVASVLRLYPREAPLLLCGAPGLIGLYRRGFAVFGANERVFVLPEAVTRIAAALGHLEILRTLGMREVS